MFKACVMFWELPVQKREQGQTIVQNTDPFPGKQLEFVINLSSRLLLRGRLRRFIQGVFLLPHKKIISMDIFRSCLSFNEEQQEVSECSRVWIQHVCFSFSENT